ncbi:MAG: hypothetical protein HQL44_06300 [Alphaproteobacteria bacterium]|nr:hypothetical protein [Alphaproteobacteria bacterium]
MNHQGAKTPRNDLLLGALVSWWFCLSFSAPQALGQTVEPTSPQPPPRVSPPDTVPSPPTRSRWPDAFEYIQLSRSTKPYWTAGKADQVLDQACRTGQFIPVSPLRLAAVFNGKEGAAVLGVIPKGRHDLLIDPGKLAREGETYFFYSANWGNCRVFYTGPLGPRKKPTGKKK